MQPVRWGGQDRNTDAVSTCTLWVIHFQPGSSVRLRKNHTSWWASVWFSSSCYLGDSDGMPLGLLGGFLPFLQCYSKTDFTIDIAASLKYSLLSSKPNNTNSKKTFQRMQKHRTIKQESFVCVFLDCFLFLFHI